MKAPSDHMRTLRRRVDFLKSREHKNSFDLAELGALEWAIVNLQPAVQEPWGYGRMLWDDKLFLPTLPSVRDGGWLPLYTTPPAQPAPIPDAITDNSESPAYAAGWNDCRQAMLEMMK